MPEIDPDEPFPFPGPGDGFPFDPLPFPLPRPLPDPLPPGFPMGRKDGGTYSGPPSGFTEALGAAKYSVARVGATIFVRAQGTLGYSAQIADLKIDSRLIYPPQLRFVVYTPTGPMLAVTRKFNFVEQFGFPERPTTLTIHDAEGQHVIPIEGAAPAGRTDLFPAIEDAEKRAKGYGKSLQEAFDNAVKALPAHSDIADDLIKYVIVESGFLRGGFAGVEHYYAVVEFQSTAAIAADGEGA